MREVKPGAKADVRTALLRFWSSIPCHLLALACVASYYVATSWRRWNDPLIDFGRELYLPWRIAGGAVLYRDVDDYYGPLSQYVNAGLFALFGPGLMRLVVANLLVFAAIVTTLYLLLRRAWGAGAALVASTVFIAVFGFSHFFEVNNHNYATPYAHETTHGMLILLLLVAVLMRWLAKPVNKWCPLAGFLFGLTAVLKPEIMLAAGLLTATAAVLHRRGAGRLTIAGLGAWAIGAVLPTLVFAGYFLRHLPVMEAWAAACHAWLTVVSTTRYTGVVSNIHFLGFDAPWSHLIQHIAATGIAVGVIAVVVVLGRILGRQQDGKSRAIFGIPMLLAILCASWSCVVWIEIGRCLLGLVSLYLAWHVVTIQRNPVSAGRDVVNLRLLLAVLAMALMLRMMLNGRIYQFGYYQAALAGTVVSAVLVGEVPALTASGRWRRSAMAAGVLALLLPGVAVLTVESQLAYRRRTYAVGEGVDQFFAFSPQFDRTGELVQTVAEQLRHQPAGQTLLVLPEGEMLNYLARMPSPLAPFFYFSEATEGGREQRLLETLKQRPPDWVVIISRDLRARGIKRYGERPGAGQLLVQWVTTNYRVDRAIGGDPLDFRQSGAIILQQDRLKLPDKPSGQR
ncbi:MAG: hypothetical protein ABSA12_08935 [Verrucomicrobiia bacterium]